MIEYILFKTALYIFHFIPFWLLYGISDIFSFINYHFIGYRKKIILKNLKESFPEKSDKEIKSITKKFYSFLSDILLESLKGYTISLKKLSKRFEFKDIEILEKFYNEGKDIILISGHCGNWELGARISPYFLKHELTFIYKPLSNKRIDNYIKMFRKRENSFLISMYETSKAFENHTKPYGLVLLTDQRPRKKDSVPEIMFLNHPTQFLPGIEIYSHKTNNPVIFFWTEKVKRGHYRSFFEVITENPSQYGKWEITRKFAELMEKQINITPENWLWSHNRWK